MSGRWLGVVAWIVIAAGPAYPSASDGVWQSLSPPQRLSPAAACDPVGDRMILIGGSAGLGVFNDAWSLSFAGVPNWSPITTSGSPPAQIKGAIAFYDPIRSRIIVVDPSLQSVAILALATSTWTTMTMSAPSTPNTRCSIVYDPPRDRLLAFGGATIFPREPIILTSALRSLALTPGATWTVESPGGVIPLARYLHAAIYDPVRDRMVVFGGATAAGGVLDSWALSLADLTWSPLSPAGTAPTANSFIPAMYDPVGDAMIVFGSTSAIGILSLAGQGQWQGAVPPAPYPTDANGFVVVCDPIRSRLLLTGGSGETWALDLGGTLPWAKLIRVPPPRAFHSVAEDVPGDRLVIFGGLVDPVIYSNDTWVKGLGDDSNWRELFPAGTIPPPRAGQAAVFDSQRRRLLMFGGDVAGGVSSDTWALTLDDPPTWTQLHPLGATPGPRDWEASIYDPVGQQMLMFGGGLNNITFNDTWALSVAGVPRWTLLNPIGPLPEARGRCSGVYDSRRGRMIVFGGDGSSGRLSDTWALELGGAPRWTQLAVAGSPGVHFFHVAIYDSVADRMVVYGGANDTQLLRTVWALSFATDPPVWSQLQPSGIGPTPRLSDGAAFDPARRQMIIAQGQIPGQAPASGFTTDTWAITWPLDQPTPVAASLVSAQATPTEVRLRWYAATSPIGPVTLERSVAHEPWARLGEIEADGTGTLSFTDRSVTPGTRYGYRLRLGESGGAAPATEAWVDVPAAALLSLRGAWPNPSGGNPSIVFSLPGTAPTTLELFDVTGRSRWVREVGSYGPGTHLLSLVGLDLPPGVYLARLKQSGETRSARLVVTR